LQITTGLNDILGSVRDYVIGLYDIAGSMAETDRQAEYYRSESDTVQAEGSLFRHLFIFVKLVATSFIRDYVLSRFLIAREELVLKSCITRELTIDSKIA
jgi:hypothetical protein